MANEVEIVVTDKYKKGDGFDSARAGGKKMSEEVSKGVKDLNDTIAATERHVGKLKAEFERTGNMQLLKDIDKDERALKRFSRQLAKFVDDAEGAGKDAGRKLGDGVEQGAGGGGGFGKKLGGMFKAAGPALLTAGAAVGALAGAALVKGVQSAMERETAVAKLGAQLHMEPGEHKKLGALAGKLYSEAYGDSMGAVTEAVAAVRSSISGLATDKSLETATVNAMNFATAFDVDVERAALVAGVAIKSGLAKDATEAFDLMTAAAQAVPKALRENVLDAAEEYSDFFHQLGFSGPAAFDALARGAAKGQFGIDKVGDAIKEFTIRATDGSKLTTDAYKAMGLSSDKMSNDVLAGGDKAKGAFDKIVAGLLKIEDPTKRANTAIALFGTPLEDLSTGEIPAFLQSMQNLGDGLGDVEGRAKSMGDTLNDTAAAKIESFKRKAMGHLTEFGAKALEVLEDPTFQEFGKAIGDSAKEAGPAFKDMMMKIGDAFEEHKPEIMELIRLLGPVLKGVFAFYGTAIPLWIRTISRMVNTFKTVSNAAVSFALTVVRTVHNIASVMARIPGPQQAMWRSIRDGAASAVRSLTGVRNAINGIKSKHVTVSVGINAPAGAMAALRGIGARAHGGIVGAIQGAANGGIRNGLTLAGEFGPELLELPPSTVVHPAGTTRRMMEGAGGGRPAMSAQPLVVRGSALLEKLVDEIAGEVRKQGGQLAVLGLRA